MGADLLLLLPAVRVDVPEGGATPLVLLAETSHLGEGAVGDGAIGRDEEEHEDLCLRTAGRKLRDGRAVRPHAEDVRRLRRRHGKAEDREEKCRGDAG